MPISESLPIGILTIQSSWKLFEVYIRDGTLYPSSKYAVCILLLQILLPLILRLLTMMTKVLFIQLLTSIVPQNLIPSSMSCYQVGDYVVVKHNNNS